MPQTKRNESLLHAQRIAHVGNWDWNTDTGTLYWSDELFRIHGLARSPHVSFNDYVESVDRDDFPAFMHEIGVILAGKSDAFALEYRIRRPDGSVRCLAVRGEVVEKAGERPLRIIGTVHDITETRELQDKLRDSELKYRSIVEESLLGVFISQDSKLVFANSRICKATGYTQDELLAMDFIDLVEGADQAALIRHFEEAEHRKQSSKILRIRCKDGRLLTVEVLGKYVVLGGKPSIVGSVQDITEKIAAEIKLNQMALHDNLTGLPNRIHFEQQLRSELQICKEQDLPLAIMLLDLDRFTLINESLGHSFGDKLLMLVTERLRSCMPAGQATLARLGGDEFAVLLPRLAGHRVPEELALCLQRKLEEPFYLDRHEWYVTTSIGISYYPIDGTDPDTLIKNADIALHRAKAGGKNNYQIFTSSMNVDTYRRFLLEKDLRKALVNDEFEVFYQPRVDGRSGAVIAAEALIRWRHPEWGLIAPSEFIPIAEATGLIVPIGEWVLRQALRRMGNWHARGRRVVPVSVNISSQHFLKESFPADVKRLLKESGVEGKWLELELTESTLMENTSAAADALRQLKEAGVKIALDDFGTGYSSLSYLTQFPFDIIKMDRSFIRELPGNPRIAGITKAIIAMAGGLDMEIVAEGVENAGQLLFLREQNCHHIQGYLFSPPVPAEGFEAQLANAVIAPGCPEGADLMPSGEARQDRPRLGVVRPVRTAPVHG